MFNIDIFLSNIEKYKTITLDKENVSCRDMIEYIKSGYDVIKYRFKYIRHLDDNKKPELIDPFLYNIILNTRGVDVVTNIKCNTECEFIFNKEKINCNINSLTIPIINIHNVYPEFKIKVDTIIELSYDVYIFNNKLREEFRKYIEVTNNENLLFNENKVTKL